MNEAAFDVDIPADAAQRFAELSGDWNPLHTDQAYAQGTTYKRTILHGAFSAGLLSRMAGMHLPGRDCLLHGMRLKFVQPIFPPAKLRVAGRVARSSAEAGMVEVTISDRETGIHYVEGNYEFGYHRERLPEPAAAAPSTITSCFSDAPILVTGASGGLGSAMLRRLRERGLGVSRSGAEGMLKASTASELATMLGDRRIAGIVHCGWPTMDNKQLIGLGAAAPAAIGHHVAQPLEDMVQLARLLSTNGVPGAGLVLVGSTAALPGRHNWRTPLYSLGKALIPTLASILALELGGRGHRCIGVAFDVIDGGMNSSMRPAVRIAHADRTPSGTLASVDDAAGQIDWVLSNASTLISGATLTLSGGALP